MPLLARALLMLTALAFVGCHGSGSDNSGSSSTTTTTAPEPGALLTNPPALVSSLAPSSLLGLLSGSPLGQTFLQLTYTPTCTVNVYRLTYDTTDPAGNLTPASGALMVPSGTSTGCSGSRPIVLYAHGTSTEKTDDISQLTSNGNAEGVLLAAVFAAQGYIVVAPNYLGYDISTLGYHPYLIAKQQSREMIDSLKAARSALPVAAAVSTTDGGKLFVTGYSEGGYVAMATHSAMQAAGITVTASAPMSGPYALAALGDAIFEGEVSANANVSVALLTVAYQNAYGDIYATPADLFETRYAGTVPTLLPNSVPVSQLETDGEFPTALFSSTPPSQAYAIYTPATSPASLASVFAAGFGTNDLVNNTYRGAYLSDALANPDGGFPALTTGVPAAEPANELRIELKDNDLRNWVPTAPTLLCGGSSDPEVFFFNTTLMQNYWTTHPPTTVPVFLDVDSSPTSNDPYASLKIAFAAAKALVEADGGPSAVLADYHATLVPPFCLSAVKSFFDTH
jgi:pimeloyl-ACP methyl ester carboxylesterase